MQRIPKINPSVSELLAAAPDPPKAPVLRSPEERAAFWLEHMVDVVYVIQGDPGTPVKIGKAVDVAARLRTLQTGSFMLLRLLDVIPGGYRVENQVHRALAGDRLQGEWFKGQATDRFLAGLEAHAIESIRAFVEEDAIPPIPSNMLPPPVKRKRASGFKSSDFGGNSLGHRWRTQNGQSAPMKVRFVDPASLRDAA